MTMRDTLGFLTAQSAHIETEVFQRQYEPVTYPELAYVDTSAWDYAESVIHYSQDFTGRPALLAQRGTDIPMVNVQRAQHIVPVHEYALGYDWTDSEIQQAMRFDWNLPTDKAAAAMLSAELELQDIFENGRDELGFVGFVNASAVTATAAHDAGSSAINWDDKTPDQIMVDVNAGLSRPYANTRRNFLCDTIALPEGAITHLSSTRMPDTGDTMYEWIREKNQYTQETGMPLRIRALSALRTAATVASVAGQGRMIAYRNNRDVLRFHVPMPYQFLAPLRKNSITWEVAGMFRTGGLEIRLPGAMAYIDGIWPAP